MTIPEINETFDELAAIVREAGLGWLEDEVRADLVEGKLEVVAEADLARPQNGQVRRRTPRSGEEFLRSQEYSPEERLLALIDAIEATVVQASDFEMQLVKSFIGREGVEAVVFSDEQSGTAVDLDPTVAVRRHEAAAALRKQLEELRLEVTSR
jgi:hypothetical protein